MNWLSMFMRWYGLKHENSSKLFRVSNLVVVFVQFLWGLCGHYQAKCWTRKLFHYGSSIFLFNFMIFGWVYWPVEGDKCKLVYFGEFCLHEYNILKEASNEKVFNYKVVKNLKILPLPLISPNLELACSNYAFLKWKEIEVRLCWPRKCWPKMCWLIDLA